MNTITPTKKQSIIQMIKFTFFSISAGLIQIITFTLMTELTKLPYWPCYVTALILSVLFNFTVNRKFTFKSAKNIPLAMMQIACYYLVFTPLSTWWGNALTSINVNEYIVLIGTMLINFITEFLYSRLVIYRKSMYTNKEGQKEIEEINK